MVFGVKPKGKKNCFNKLSWFFGSYLFEDHSHILLGLCLWYPELWPYCRTGSLSWCSLYNWALDVSRTGKVPCNTRRRSHGEHLGFHLHSICKFLHSCYKSGHRNMIYQTIKWKMLSLFNQEKKTYIFIIET